MSQQEYITNYNDDDELRSAFHDLDMHIKHMDERKKFIERELKSMFERRQELWIVAEKLMEEKGMIEKQISLQFGIIKKDKSSRKKKVRIIHLRGYSRGCLNETV